MPDSNLDTALNSLPPNHSTDHVSSPRRAVRLGQGMEQEKVWDSTMIISLNELDIILIKLAFLYT